MPLNDDVPTPFQATISVRILNLLTIQNPICAVCGEEEAQCPCRPCRECGERGNPVCVTEHNDNTAQPLTMEQVWAVLTNPHLVGEANANHFVHIMHMIEEQKTRHLADHYILTYNEQTMMYHLRLYHHGRAVPCALTYSPP